MMLMFGRGRMKILLQVITVLLFAVVSGCSHRRANPQRAERPATYETTSAIQFVKKSYPSVVVEKVDEKTIGVIWESGADEEFQKLRTAVYSKFGVDAVITAIE
jgi:hypothetical protein